MNKLACVTIFDCLNGFFTRTDTLDSIAEGFQKLPDRGAIAVLAATGLSYASRHQLLATNFYDLIFQGNQFGLGAAFTAAQIASYSRNSEWSELVETFMLFGDPFTQLGVGARLSLITPHGGEVIDSGSTFPIQWFASRDMVKFALTYSTNNGHAWKNITKKGKGTLYNWYVPNFKKNMKKCLVRLTGYDASGKKIISDVSDSTFTIRKTSN